jgi:hypothetical protein
VQDVSIKELASQLRVEALTIAVLHGEPVRDRALDGQYGAEHFDQD